ncbi:MAG: iron ABC transporter substrate-binding protein [Janthinobacterium lividum]
MTQSRRAALALGLAVLAPLPALAAPAPLTIYAAQHHQLVDMVAQAFTKETGIPVRSRFGEAPELASQIVREGARSPADIYFTENSPELTLLDEKALLAPVTPATLAQVPAQHSASTGRWLGVLARENVLAYDPAKLKTADLPASLLDLARPEWKGRVAIAPSDADFLPLVQAVVVLKGRDAALAWLKGLKANAQVFDDDEGVVSAVERGTVAAGVINSYYFYRARVEQGADKTRSEVHHFGGGDVGGLLNISGAAVLKSSRNQDEAQRFLAFMVSRPVQEMLARSDIDFEYPLVPGVAPNAALKPMDQLQPPALTLQQLGDDQDSAKLLRQSGLL